MASNNKNVNIKINADSKNAEKGLNSITAKLNSFGKSLNKNQAISGFSKLGMAFTAITGPLGVVTKGLKVAVNTIKDLNESALKQIKAEKQLETAAKNNPFLNKESVQDLKDFASHLQDIGTIGDEEILPMMAQLASAGRDQAQIQDIMSAALDVSASGAMSFESAVDALNKSLNGQVGYLGQICPQVKTLTSEQLKNGEAITAVANSYAGMSAEVTKATGAGQQLTNAWGDLKEAMGMGWTKIISPIQRFFTWAIKGVTEVANKFNKILGITSSANIKPSDATKEQMENLDVEIKAEEEKLKIMQKQRENAEKNSAESAVTIWENALKRIDELKAKREKSSLSSVESKELTKLLQSKDSLQADAEAEKARGDNPGASSTSYNATKEQEALEQQINIDKEKRNRLEELYNKQIEAESLTLEENADQEEEKLDDSLINKWINANKTEVEQIKEELELLLERKELLEGKGLDTTKVQQAIDNCNKALKETEFTSFMNKLQSVFDTVASVSTSLADGIKDAVSIAQSAVDTTTDYELQELENQYSNGLVTAEEYASKKEEIEKKSAEKSYELNMYTWTAELLEATASGALATVKALSSTSNMYVNIAMAGLAASLAGVQIGTLLANKPVKPSFSTGGIVSGSTNIGGRDTTTANLSAREMVLTMAQQKQLFNIANGAGGGSGVVLNMPIENTASDLVSVSKVQTNDGYKILIQQAVNEGLNKGVFNSGLKTAQSTFNGRNYTN